MDSTIDPKIEKQSIYDIYRACRLCGAGAGYKMPIIQNVVDLDDTETQLKEKILDCVQIEVHQDDKMPPLICELCVDKVNDFYEFLEMCKQTNRRTRLRLGLPLQSNSKSNTDDCILGMTEAIYVNSDSEGEPSSKVKKTAPQINRIRVKKPSEMKPPLPIMKLNTSISKEESKPRPKGPSRRETTPPTPPRTTRSKPSSDKDGSYTVDSEDEAPLRTTRLKARREPTPPCPNRPGRPARSSRDDAVALQQLQELSTKTVRTAKIGPKCIMKKEKDLKVVIMPEDQPLLIPRLKRLESQPPASDSPPAKKVKIALKPIALPPKPAPRSTPKIMIKPPSKPAPTPKASPKAPAKPPPPPRPAPTPPQSLYCTVCALKIKTTQGYLSHMKLHQVTFTSPKMACNACREWFPSTEEAQAHHKHHQTTPAPYTCRQCFADYGTEQQYEKHFGDKLCIPVYEVSDIKCDECWHQFPTQHLYNEHQCGGERGRPGGKCYRCKQSHALLRNLMRHEMNCSSKKKKGAGEVRVSERLLLQLKPLQVRLARCDRLLLRETPGGHCDVSAVPVDFGYDSDFVYPFYLSSRYALDGMVSIAPEIKDELCKQQFSYWDSDSDTEDLVAKKKGIESLRTLSLKAIFSHKFLGKIPKKLKTMRLEKSAFDSLFNDADEDVKRDIDKIIDKLGLDDDDDDFSKKATLDKSASENTDRMNGTSVVNDKVVASYETNDDSSSNKDLSAVDGTSTNDLSVVNDNTSSSKGNDESQIKNDDKSSNNDDEQTSVSYDTNINDSAKNNVENKVDVSESVNAEVDDGKVDEKTHSENYVDTNSNEVNDKTATSEKNEGKRLSNDSKSITNNAETSEDVEDRKLMEELDAQIADNSGCNDKSKRVFNERIKSKSKIAGDSVAVKNNENSMDLDSISDEEFNFDN